MPGYERRVHVRASELERTRRTEPTPDIKVLEAESTRVRGSLLRYYMEQYIMGVITRGELANYVYAVELKHGRIESTVVSPN